MIETFMAATVVAAVVVSVAYIAIEVYLWAWRKRNGSQ